jgi:hypothetical protein
MITRGNRWLLVWLCGWLVLLASTGASEGAFPFLRRLRLGKVSSWWLGEDFNTEGGNGRQDEKDS